MKRALTILLATVFIVIMCASVISAEDEYIDPDNITVEDYIATLSEPQNPPEAIFDGSTGTRWGAITPGEEVTVSFDKAYTIGSIDVRFWRASERSHYLTFEYSMDGKTWTAVETTKLFSFADGTPQDNNGYMDNFPFTKPVTAKYFRITYEGKEDGAGSGVAPWSGNGSIWELYFVISTAAAETTPAATTTAPAATTTAPAATTTAPAATTTPAGSSNSTGTSVQTGDSLIVFVVLGAAILSTIVVIVKKQRKA